MNGLDILRLPMEDENEADATTIGEYLVTLSREVWLQGEGFSGKRPFGNSGWDHDLYKPLVKFELIKGSIDEYGYIEEVDEKAGDVLIMKAYEALFDFVYPTGGTD